MTQITRRMVLRNSLAVAAAGSLARPFIANAAASTATVWWTQGFVPEEDAAFKKLVDDYQKQSGNTIDFSLIPFAPLNQKTVSALTSGDVPDLIDINTDVLVPQNAWSDKMVDVSDVVDTQKDAYHPTVYLATQYYNNVAKKRGIYIVPYKTAVVPFHIWNSLVEKAGFKLVRRTEDMGCVLGFLQADAGQVARFRHAQHLRARHAMHHDRPERWQ